MSRIDEALRRAGVLSPAGRSEEFGLQGYPSEQSARDGSPSVSDVTARASDTIGRASDAGVRPISPAPRLRLYRRTAAAAGAGTASHAPRQTQQVGKVAKWLHERRAAAEVKTVVLSSVTASPEKAGSAIDLAVALGGDGSRVLLIDVDDQAPSVCELLGLPEVARRSTAADAIDVLTLDPPSFDVLADHPPAQDGSQRSAFLRETSARAHRIVQICAADYDWIVVSARAIQDSRRRFDPSVGRIGDAVVLVVTAGTPFSAVDEALTALGPDCVVSTMLYGIPD